MKKVLWTTFSLLTLFSESSCRSRSGSEVKETKGFSKEKTLDLMDLSLLFTLPKTQNEADQLLGVAEIGEKGPLIPFSLFDFTSRRIEFGDFVPREEQYQKLVKIMALRIDPCAPKSPKDATCQFQMRLVAQFVMQLEDEAKKGFEATDDALHLVYNLTQEEGKNVILELQELKKLSSVVTTDLALDLHPGLKNFKHRFLNDVKEFILRHVGAKNLDNIANVGVGSASGSSWTFTASRIINNKSVSLAPLPNLLVSENSDISDASGATFRGAGEEGMDPKSTSPVNAMGALILRDELEKDSKKFEKANVEKIMGQMTLIEDPIATPFFNSECVSCHRATHEKRLVEGLTGLKLPDAPMKNLKRPYNLNFFKNGGDLSKNQRNFGYVSQSPGISSRTIHETAIAADLINDMIDSGIKAETTGFECDNSKLLECRKSSVGDCFKKFCK